MLNAEELKAIYINLWNQAEANPHLAYGRKAFIKMVEAEFNKVAVAKIATFDEPVQIAG